MIKAIVTDIEGTTSSLSFVKDVLFPYARAHMQSYIQQHQDDAQVKTLLEDVSQEAGQSLDIEQSIAQLQQWIDEDRKITPLKALQGMIWEAGYASGDFHGHIYADAQETLQHWHQQGIRLYVYSSGSVYAQKLLFAHTEYGDLTGLFAGYFDTHIGAKIEAQSYRNILTDISLPGDEVLFLSDIEKELDAAREAGMQTTWLVRDAEPDRNATHLQVSDFPSIPLT